MRPVRLLHLVDDEKFIHFVADVFTSLPGVENQFVVFVDDPGAPLRHTAGLPRSTVHARSSRAASGLETVWDATVMHYLDMAKIRYFRRLARPGACVWSGWGADYYEVVSSLGHDLVGEASARLWRDATRDASDLRALSRGRTWLARHVHEWRMRRFMRRVDVFSAPIPDDFHVVRPHLKGAVRYAQLNYASVERTFEVGGPRQLEPGARDVLVGNSSSPTNNHVEMFEALRSALEGHDGRVIVPLGYGHPAYRDAVVAAGRRLLGERFVPLTGFMPLADYNSLIASCGAVVMGHRRQQAVGNIVTMLYKGARLFLEPRTTTSAFLRERGAVIHDIGDIAARPGLLREPLTEDQRARNAQVVLDFWAHERVRSNALALVTSLRER